MWEAGSPGEFQRGVWAHLALCESDPSARWDTTALQSPVSGPPLGLRVPQQAWELGLVGTGDSWDGLSLLVIFIHVSL